MYVVIENQLLSKVSVSSLTVDNITIFIVSLCPWEIKKGGKNIFLVFLILPGGGDQAFWPILFWGEGFTT